MQLGDKVLDTKYNRIVPVDHVILSAKDKLKDRWKLVDRKGNVCEDCKEEVKEEVTEEGVEDVRAEYLEAKGEEVPVNKKNNIEWMKTKIEETK